MYQECEDNATSEHPLKAKSPHDKGRVGKGLTGAASRQYKGQSPV
jgi:hypothetical protein